MANPLMSDIKLDEALKSHRENGEAAAKERYTTSLAGAVASLQAFASRIAATHDDEVDGANAASDGLDRLTEGLKRHSALMLPQPAAGLPSGSTPAQSPDPRVEELQRQVTDLRQEIGDKDDELVRLERELRDLKRSSDKLERDNAALKEEARKGSNLQTKVDEAKAAQTKAEHDLAEEQAKTAQLRQELTEERGKTTQLERDNRTLNSRVQELQGRLNASRARPTPPPSVSRTTPSTPPAQQTPPAQPADDAQEHTDEDTHVLDRVGTPEPPRKERDNGRPVGERRRLRDRISIPGHHQKEGN